MHAPPKPTRTLLMVGAAGALLVAAAFIDPIPRAGAGALPAVPPAPASPQPVASAPALPECAAPTAASPSPSSRGDPAVRQAAHRGLQYLSRASRQWTDQHGCFGCHVQAVTLEALSAGEHHRYDVAAADMEAMVQALQKGVTAGGRVTGAAFEGAAWARYDRWVSDKHTAELLRYADELISLQDPSGAIVDDDARRPITGGTMQTTFQAAQTWRQAHARTADEKWLVPLRRAESFLARTAEGWRAEPARADLQDLDFAILGLLASGASAREGHARALLELLSSRQRADGGWSLGNGDSDAFATGQAVYTLKMAGFGDADARVARGLKYLLSTQGAEGSWRTYRSGQGGAEKGETMWAVLGLVTVDVASIAVEGLADGQHVDGALPITARATDNTSGGIAHVELRIDDLPVARACGGELRHTWATAGLERGVHVVEVVAVNGQGQASRRRFELFTGDVHLTQVAAGFDEGTLQSNITLRNVSREPGAVVLEVWSVASEADPRPQTRVFEARQPATEGPMSFAWAGQATDGRALPRGRYLAKLTFRDAQGAERQSESALFFHDRLEAQQAQYSEVEGKLSMDKGQLAASNTVVELLDDRGNVVQTTRTTDQGNYRFKNVNEGNYRVRTRKQGFRELESQVSTKVGAKSAAHLAW